MGIRTPREAYLLSGISAQVTGGKVIDMRATNGHFVRWYSASADGPTGNGSAIFQLLHSHDQTAWTIIETVTAVEGVMGTAQYSGGAYGYLMASANKVYSAAETGTGAVWVHIQPGVA